jgi:hypothetical protein
MDAPPVVEVSFLARLELAILTEEFPSTLIAAPKIA